MTYATNASVMRTSNRKLVLDLIRREPISRAELAERTQLTRPSITQIVDELLAAGLVEPCSDVPDNGTCVAPGRRRTLLALRHNARFVIGIHISRRCCHVGAVDLCGNVCSHVELPMEGNAPEDTVDAIAAAVREQMERLPCPREHFLGIGVSAPGPVDYRAGVIINPPNFDQWHNLPICAMLTARTGLPSLLEKDTNARALEEKYFGAARNASNFMLVQIDDGVGSGVVVNDALYRGHRGFGTEIGHTTIRYDGPPCRCGGRGCLENYLRIPHLLAGSPYDGWEQLITHATEPDAAEILDRAAEYLTAALVNGFNLYDLEHVFLSGDVAAFPQPLLERLTPLIGARVLSRVNGTPVSACIGSQPVRTGAMAALYDYFQKRD